MLQEGEGKEYMGFILWICADFYIFCRNRALNLPEFINSVFSDISY